MEGLWLTMADTGRPQGRQISSRRIHNREASPQSVTLKGEVKCDKGRGQSREKGTKVIANDIAISSNDPKSMEAFRGDGTDFKKEGENR